eukprot:TRINITY_DN7777_c0_g1_i2.p1 TRINITY_DN7777_c0_g1~~TRINITY_DN7777_c0_g1_i2.p1  ORF type:complete len:169 (-),score=32.30 TRINITY_DN7777_c0_g1_i2:477-983(-)
MILPLAKLGTLVLKTLSKPLASRLKTQAATHPRFRELIVNFAQANHRLTVNVQRRIYGHATDVEIRPLNEEKAIQSATELVGEVFIFTVAGVLVVFEVSRSARSEARKEEARKQELEELKSRDEAAVKEIEDLKERLSDLERSFRGRGFTAWLPSSSSSSTGTAPAGA